ncbi:S9 family peptidase [Pleomorphovibrio marinus]|uniref:S9 family peptidase n=1 Tax=Pleomorphovibrio marinus TaxID=2164132 RepID=UPI000E0C1FDE|nr:S9 family peptidase [Pleomorphovibrio marinus]
MDQPPIATKKISEIFAHEESRKDPYYWLKERDNPEVIAYLNEENAFHKSKLAYTDRLQHSLYEEMKSRIKEDDEGVPYFKGGYFYFHKYVKGGEYPLYCRKKGTLEAEEEVILNVNELAKGHEFFQIGGLGTTEDQNMLCFAFDNVGRRIYQLTFKKLNDGEILRDEIGEVTGNFVWDSEGKSIFYSKQDPNTLRAYQIYRHVLGTSQADDQLIYEETDETFTCHVSKSKSKEYIFLVSQSTVSSEYRFIPSSTPEKAPTLIQSRKRDLEYDVDHGEGDFLILTNAHSSKNFKLVKAPIGQPGIENWVDFIPHNENVLLEGFEVFKNHLVLQERFNGQSRLEVRNSEGREKHTIRMDDPAYTVWIGNNPEYYTQVLRFGYNSLTTPSSVFDYDMVSHERVLMKQQEVVGGHDPSAYCSERLWARAEDGTEIPVSLVYKKSLFEKNGTAPLLLYGYGSYGLSMDPTFSSHRLSLLDRGMVFAIAHIRGGQEMGRYWYEQGKMLQKKNTFSDYIACAEHLIKERYAAKDKLFGMGGSAGGLLMGTVINWRPDLFKGVVAAVPFVDVVTTMLDETIPLTTGEFDEWGNPKDKTYYDYMLSYSPYDNVKAQEYPHLLVTSGLHDSQVQYWEPTKWVAKLREMKTDDHLLLLYTNMDAGHGGASGRFKALKELAMEYAFLLDLAGLNPSA